LAFAAFASGVSSSAWRPMRSSLGDHQTLDLGGPLIQR
jgi:hypothetical protein